MGNSDWATINHICPELRVYSRTQLRQAAAELSSLTDTSTLKVLLKDYTKMREACRLVAQKAERLHTNWRTEFGVNWMN